MAQAIPNPTDCCATCDCTDTQTQVSLISNIVANFSFATYTAVRGYTAYVANQLIGVAGRAAALDGGEGVFIYISTSTTADNDGTVLRPNNVAVGSAGRWHRLA